MSRLPIALSSAIAIALAVAAGPVAALGLGQIQVQSQPGQPLLAEIPIISSDPSELQGLQVQLASPETFSRIGLEPPQGDVSTLHFEPALDAAGHPVIRVTSPAPMQQPLLTFLIEVDWGQGRLVREYSALLDAPRTVSAPLQPPIQAPVVAPSNTIVRPAVAPVPTAAAPQSISPAPTANATPAPTPVPASAPPPVAVVPMPESTPPPSNQYGPVKAGETLGQIAATIEPAQEHSAAQTMLALLRANPDAFIDGNVNLLKRGAILQMPDSAELAHYSASEAAALVHAQIVQWRALQHAVSQPVASQAATATSPPPAVHDNSTAARASRTTASRTTDARLDIMPPSSSRGKRAGAANQATQSGIQAGGEGDMLRQQLQETKETLAARDAEVNELKTRVADLEKLQQQQQQLLTLKDSALAAAQQTLATANRKSAAPAIAKPAPVKTTADVATTTHQPAAQPQPSERASGTFWLWGGIVLVLVALAGWLLSRRRPREVTVSKRNFDTAALAASIPAGVDAQEPVDADPLFAVPAKATTAAPAMTPSAQRHSASASAPTWHGVAEIVEPAAEPPKDQQQLERAQSLLDRGDDDSARKLLLEVLDGRDPAARETAARLLRDL